MYISKWTLAAAVLTDHHAQGRVRVRSAGSQPGSEVNPTVARVLRERGLDPDREFPKPLTDDVAHGGATLACPHGDDEC